MYRLDLGFLKTPFICRGGGVECNEMGELSERNRLRIKLRSLSLPVSLHTTPPLLPYKRNLRENQNLTYTKPFPFYLGFTAAEFYSKFRLEKGTVAISK